MPGEMVQYAGNDKTSINEAMLQAEKWFKQIDKSGLQVRYKAWCY